MQRFGKLKNSLLLRLGGMFVAITMLALVSMVTTWMLAQTTQGSGNAINVAGSLRMQSWRMAFLHQRLQHEPEHAIRAELDRAIDHFEDNLKAASILAVLPPDETAPLKRSYEQIEVDWHTHIRPGLTGDPASAATRTLLSRIPAFVSRINMLVNQIEESTEAKILVMRVILGASVLATAFVVALSIYLVNHILVYPVRGLLALTDQIGQGNLAARTDVAGEDEIGRLGQAFNLMAEDLSRMYQNLEARVEEKTGELTVANRSLELLYHSIARLYTGPISPDTYTVLLRDMENVLGLGRGVACLVETGGGRAHVLASTLDPARGDVGVCGLTNCGECLVNRKRAVHSLRDGTQMLALPLADAEQQYGVLQLEMPQGMTLASWQIQLLEALSRHIGIAIGTARRIEQSRRLSLLEERAALARELHDSLAQSLAYMKIQVSRLKPLVDRSGAGEDAGEVLSELREGLNSAYRQLRELLTTFRLRIEGEGLADALQNTVAEFSARGGIPIDLDLEMAGCRLSPNEEIHALQIVREALSNVLNHAQASRAEVRMVCNGDGSVSASVSDDGVGLRGSAGTHHYGLTIMEERAKHLGGQLRVENQPGRGVRVGLDFVPASQAERIPPSQPVALK